MGDLKGMGWPLHSRCHFGEGEAPATRLSSPKSEPELRKQLAFAAQRELRPPFSTETGLLVFAGFQNG
jgi:hypothetical protein